MARRVVKHPHSDHAARAAEMRRHPKMWVEVGRYNGLDSARATARHISYADTLPHYAPQGSFEARTRLTDDGAVVYARYLGEDRKPPTDVERRDVLSRSAREWGGEWTTRRVVHLYQAAFGRYDWKRAAHSDLTSLTHQGVLFLHDEDPGRRFYTANHTTGEHG